VGLDPPIFAGGLSVTYIRTSVSKPVYTDTGIPVFGTPNTDTDTGQNLPAFDGIENK
jgi:hypothetical protein